MEAISGSVISTVSKLGVNLGKFVEQVWLTLERTLITKDRWQYIATGLGNTLKLTFMALVLGVILGVIVAMIRTSWDSAGRDMKTGVPKFLFECANWIAKVYLTVIRGTPVVVQLLIIFNIIMADSKNKMLAATIAFGINSGAYVAELIRSGIAAVDKGQMEAGRSLGFNYIQTMQLIILPQAIKNILPALANEFIVLLKETSIAGFVGVIDLNRASEILSSQTYDAIGPILVVAVIYLIMVLVFTWLVGILERRLKKNER